MKKRLLLADDSITIQKVIQITFSHDDYVMTVVDNGDAALEKARAERPDLVLADVFMPGKNGYELCAAIKQDPSLAGTPVLLLTGTFEPFDEAKAKAVGADKWIAKPFESQALIACVEELLSKASPKPDPAVAPSEVKPALTQPISPSAPTSSTPAPQPVVPVVPIVPPPAISASPVEEDLWGGEFDAELTPMDTVSPTKSEPLPVKDEGDLWGSDFEVAAPQTLATDASSDELWGSFEEETALGPESFSPTVAPAASEQDMWGGADDLMSSFSTEESGSIALGEPDSEMAMFADVEILEEIDLSEDFTSADGFATSDTFELEAFGEVKGSPPAVEPSTFLDEAAWESEPNFGIEFKDPIAPQSTASTSTAMSIAPVSAAPASAQPGGAQLQSLNEAELEKIVEKIAGVVIERLAGSVLEKIAWEVVPDLAETMIKEELRKIRDEAVV